jgi:putative transcriptional regulator
VGDFLIASPDTVDPIFRHTVILIFHHDQNGTLGIIINQPVEVRSLASLVKTIGEDATGIDGKARVFAGGPMEPDIGFVLHSTDYRSAGTVDIDAHVAITTRPQIFVDIGHHKGPRKFLVAVGYAGWGPGQLEIELASHNWLTGTEDPTLVFDDPARIWQDALARRGREI